MGGQHHYLKEVWSPAGGWWCDPKGWKGNTAMMFGAVFLVAAPVAYYSAKNEYRPQVPRRWIPSMMWGNVPKAES